MRRPSPEGDAVLRPSHFWGRTGGSPSSSLRTTCFLLALGTGGATSSFLGGREGSWHRRMGPGEGKEVIELPTC